jgi:hypothetical protein
LSRWELHQFANRRHRGTVSAIPACDIKKSSGLAEKILDDSWSFLLPFNETN